MGSDWEELPLGEVYSYRSGLSKPRSAFGSGFGFLSFKDVFYNAFVPDELTELVRSTDRERELSDIQRGDVFLTRTSETIDDLGMSCVALCDYKDATFNGFCKRLRPNLEGQVYPEYAAYYFRSPRFRQAVTAMSSLSTRASLNEDMLNRLTIVLPPLKVQRAIGSSLKVLDDKIEANRKLNATLEATCQALFRSWFIDFDPVVAKSEGREPPHLSAEVAALFPSRLQETENGPIPDGWRISPISGLVSLSRESITPLDHPTTQFALYSIPAFDSGVGPEEQLGAAIKSNKYVLPSPCVLVSKLNPRIPRVWFPDLTGSSEPAIASTEFLVATPKDETPLEFLYQLFRSDAFIDEFATLVTGTSGSHQRVKPTDFLRLQIVVPPPALQKAANGPFSAALERVLANVRESRTLAALRDALLPRLLSGELRVRQAEELVEEAV